MKHFALFALLALFFAPAAFAQTDARVEILKSQIEGFLENQKAMALKNGCKIDTKGLITIEQADGYYALTLPAITYTDAKGIKSDIGMVAVNAVPQENNEWKISLALPTPINSYNANGSQQFKTDIGTQNATGIWNEKLGHFTSVNATFGNINMNNLKDQGTITIGALTLNSQLAEEELISDAGIWSGRADAKLSNISLFDAATSFKGTIPSITLDTNLSDRAAKTPMTKAQIKNRPQSAHPDFYNVFSFLFGAPERVTASINGLDTINGQLQQSMLSAKPEQRQKFLQAILGVSAVIGMGKPSPADPATKMYDVVFGKDGNMTLNGTDFGSVMQPVASTAGQPVLR